MKLWPGKPLALLCVLALALASTLAWIVYRPFSWERSPEPPDAQSRDSQARRSQVEAREQQADRTVWAKEILAENCGRTLEALWDDVNASSNKLERLAAFPFKEIILPDWDSVRHLPHGIEAREGRGPGPTCSAAQWRERLEQFIRAGWQLDNLEFRQNRFDTNARGQPRQSHFYFAARLTQPAASQRAIVQGDLVVDWAPNASSKEPPGIGLLDASHLEAKSRVGAPFFNRILSETISPRDKTGIIDPLIVYDLDGDGLPEIILAARNLVYHRQGSAGPYVAGNLCRFPIDFLSIALVADFDGDGLADLLCANGRGLFLFKGSSQGTFDEPARLVWAAAPPLKNAMVMTCGDIEQNGRLDVFLGQYRVPTLGQILRPHYYDANDGFPCFLLRNDGHGNFADITGSAGLAAKRWRRIYSAAFVDLDGDGRLDLSVVSDFAGLDLYRNLGQGRFADVTSRWVAEPHAFGMAQAFADFNADGCLDLLLIGMPSPTVDRLEHLGLYRGYSAEDNVRRPAMVYGNRLLIAQTNGGFAQTGLSDSIARSGWSWGCSAFDFDNDGFPDVYIANGLESRQSVKEYEPEFWLHNLFFDESVDDVSATHYLIGKVNETRGRGWSYGGYEKNRLFLNRNGESFFDIGHLAGVALEQDCRNAVSADLDGDGKMDLVVTSFEVWPQVKQTLQAFENRCPDGGHWIGFRFRERAGGRSAIGVKIRLRYAGRVAVRQVVTGDSHRSEHPPTSHFGLGAVSQVDSAEVIWSDGQTMLLPHPAADQYHEVDLSGQRVR